MAKDNISELIVPQLISKCLRPNIYWHQTDNAMFIRILLTDVKDYHLKVTEDSFKFRYYKNFIGIFLILYVLLYLP